MTHTPTPADPPWRVLESNNSSLIHIEAEATGAMIATVNAGSKAERLGKGHKIVTCVNSHADLVQALKSLLALGEVARYGFVGCNCDGCKTVQMARAVLASATPRHLRATPRQGRMKDE
jgi:hypothetical protein